jgi:S-formylglutathione hydrolase FrmB
VRPLRLVILALALLAPATAQAAPPGLRLVSSKRLDGRLRQLTLTTPALQGTTEVRVLLPRGYATAKRRYPVLYLLHGASGSDRDWTEQGQAETIAAGRQLIVVMPDGGSSGWYADWFNDGHGGPPKWETYHVRELIPWIDGHYRTRADRDGRAIAGLSMGGFGAMSYAARHPDEFVAAASFSGGVDIDSVLGDIVVPAPVFGLRAAQEVRWQGHNPTTLAGNLRPLHLTIRTGNGLPGGPFGGGDPIEVGAHVMSQDLHAALARDHIPHLWDDYGAGGHTWPYWQRDLRETLPGLMTTFRHPPTPPRRLTFTAVEPRFGAFGWTVRRAGSALARATLSGASRSGFALKGGSGAATVATPRRTYAAHRRLVLTVTDATGTHTRRLRAGRQGALSVTVHLAPTTRVTVRRAK